MNRLYSFYYTFFLILLCFYYPLRAQVPLDEPSLQFGGVVVDRQNNVCKETKNSLEGGLDAKLA